MPLDDIAEGLFRFVGRLFVEIFVDFVFDVVCYLIGKVVLRLITLGRYPPTDDIPHSDMFVSAVGLLVIIDVILTVALV